MTSHRERLVLQQARVLAAPAERVFGLVTEPTALAKWWGPHGFATPEVQIDLCVGGRSRRKEKRSIVRCDAIEGVNPHASPGPAEPI